MNMIRFGLIGTSEISSKMAQALSLCPKTVPHAIYSRNLQKAKQFANKHRIPYPCSTLEELVGTVDAVYIASPNSFHCQQAVYFLERGIPVLCEKPLASNMKEVVQMLDAAEKNGVYLAEAYKSRWMPAYAVIKDRLKDLGTIRNVRFDFCKYSTRYDAHMRGKDVNTFKAEFSNGALLDLGVYCLYPALDLFGAPQSVCASGILVPGGADGLGCTLMTYPEFLVTLNYSKVSDGPRQCEIQGEQGTMFIDAISSPRRIEIVLRTGESTVLEPVTYDNDMIYECTAFAEALERGDRCDPSLILSSFRILDSVRKAVGIRYPADLDR